MNREGLKMGDAERIILAFNQGMNKVHERLDDIQKTCASRQVACYERMSDIEKEAAIKEAVCEVQQENAEQTKDPWRWLARAVVATVGGAATIWIILMIIEHISLLTKAVAK